MNNCCNCGEQIISKDALKFCGSSCAAQYNNKIRKRNPWSEEARMRFSLLRKEQVELGKTKMPVRKKISSKSDRRTRTKKRESIQCECCHTFFIKNSNCNTKCRKCRYSKIYKKYIQRNIKYASVECVICNVVFNKKTTSPRKTCSEECCKKLQSIKASDNLKKNNYRYQLRGNRSYMEITFENWLQQKGMQKGIKGYLTEVKFYNKETKKYGFCDFVFPTKKLIIELDGTHHIKRRELDEIRDRHLNTRGYNVLRITQREYIKKTRIEEVEKLLW